jgi:hypothetical protein
MQLETSIQNIASETHILVSRGLNPLEVISRRSLPKRQTPKGGKRERERERSTGECGEREIEMEGDWC